MDGGTALTSLREGRRAAAFLLRVAVLVTAVITDRPRNEVLATRRMIDECVRIPVGGVRC